MIEIGALLASAGFLAATLAAIACWALAVRHRVPGDPWWRAAALATARLTERGRGHRRRAARLALLALGLLLVASVLATLLICCQPPGGRLGGTRP